MCCVSCILVLEASLHSWVFKHCIFTCEAFLEVPSVGVCLRGMTPRYRGFVEALGGSCLHCRGFGCPRGPNVGVFASFIEGLSVIVGVVFAEGDFRSSQFM